MTPVGTADPATHIPPTSARPPPCGEAAADSPFTSAVGGTDESGSRIGTHPDAAATRPAAPTRSRHGPDCGLDQRDERSEQPWTQPNEPIVQPHVAVLLAHVTVMQPDLSVVQSDLAVLFTDFTKLLRDLP